MKAACARAVRRAAAGGVGNLWSSIREMLLGAMSSRKLSRGQITCEHGAKRHRGTTRTYVRVCVIAPLRGSSLWAHNVDVWMDDATWGLLGPWPRGMVMFHHLSHPKAIYRDPGTSIKLSGKIKAKEGASHFLPLWVLLNFG